MLDRSDRSTKNCLSWRALQVVTKILSNLGGGGGFLFSNATSKVNAFISNETESKSQNQRAVPL